LLAATYLFKGTEANADFYLLFGTIANNLTSPLALKAALNLVKVIPNDLIQEFTELLIEVLNKLMSTHAKENADAVNCLFALLEKQAQEIDAVTVLLTKFLSKRNESTLSTLKGLRKISQTEAGPVARYYFKNLGPNIIVLLKDIVAQKAPSPLEVSIANEILALLVIGYAIAPAEQKYEMLKLLTSIFISSLEVTFLKVFSLEVLLKFATIPDFKTILSTSISPKEKQVFETHLLLWHQEQQAIAQKQQQKQQKQTVVATAKPLKMDFSKYKK